jgi:Tfp pilus assembly protein FimT
MMMHCVALLLLVVATAHGAGIVEDHKLAWAAAGLSDSLAAGHEAALPAALYAAVVTAAPKVQRESSGGESFKFGKHNTWWLPLNDGSGKKRPPPRSAIEAAVHVLHDLDFGDAPTPVVGAEWWLQERRPAENIGYHYDKDEAYASEHMTMRFPEVSTVTYLSDSGGPTLIFNQTTPDGNLEVPPLPVEAVLAYPHPNKHLVFRGNLQHGVSGSLAEEAQHTRRTLLINWCGDARRTRRSSAPCACEAARPVCTRARRRLRARSQPAPMRITRRGGLPCWRLAVLTACRARPRCLAEHRWRYEPMPPNCVRFPAKRWRELDLALDARAIAALVGPASAAAAATNGAGSGGAVAASAPHPITWSPMAVQKETARRITVEVAPTDQLYFTLPPTGTVGNGGNWHVQWGAGEAVGPLARLDLHHQRSLNAIFSDARPKLFLVMPSRSYGKTRPAGEVTQWADSLPNWLVALHATYGAQFKFVLAEPRESADFMKQFGLSMADVPTAAIHDTPRSGHKYRMHEKLRKATIWRFVRDFLAERLHKEEL